MALCGDDQAAYLSPASYDEKPGTKNEGKRKAEIRKLVSTLFSIVIPPSDHKYIQHQWDKHGNVPLWVAVKALTLGNVSKMYSLCKSSVQSNVAKEFPGVSTEDLIGMLDMLTRVRNVCAHSERLYDFSVIDKRAIPNFPIHATIGISKTKAGLYKQGKTDLFAALICLMLECARVMEEDEQYRPDAVVCVGQAGGRAAITPEMIAVNIMDARIPDNAGNKPCHELIIKEGREAYFSSLPVKDIEKNLNDNGIPSSVSYGADNE